MIGIINAIQRMSINDGPGIRSTVFLKGCNFRCRWCHNPETWSNKPQIQQIADKCIVCGNCVNACSKEIISLISEKIRIDRGLCDNCGSCSVVCPSGALSVTGKYIDASSLFDELCRDIPYYNESAGGVTLSGGEPLMQYEFTTEVLRLCKAQNIHTAIETNLGYDTARISAMIELVDLWLVDLKVLNDTIHKQQTQCSNSQSIANLRFLSSHGAQIIVRTPIIPGVNDSCQEVEAICKELSPLNILKYELLPFHTLGFDKFSQFGMKNPMVESKELSCEHLSVLNDIVKKYKLNNCSI